MTIVEQANRLMQRAEVLYERNENIMEPEDREVAKDKMSKWVEVFHQATMFQLSGSFSRSAKGLKNNVRERFWLAQAEEAKRYFSHAQEVLRVVKVGWTTHLLREVLIDHLLSDRESSTKQSEIGSQTRASGLRT